MQGDLVAGLGNGPARHPGELALGTNVDGASARQADGAAADVAAGPRSERVTERGGTFLCRPAEAVEPVPGRRFKAIPHEGQRPYHSTYIGTDPLHLEHFSPIG